MTELETKVRADLDAHAQATTAMKRLDAVVDASRRSLLVAVPRLRAQIDAATRDRDARPVDESSAAPLSGARDSLFVIATLLGIIAAALVLPSPRNGRPALGIDQGALWVGLFAVASVVLFATQEPVRPRSKYFGREHARNAPRIFLFLAILWVVVLGYILLSWEDVDAYEPALPIVGVALLVLAIAGALVLWWRSRRIDSAQVAAASSPDPVAQWWHTVGETLTPSEYAAGAEAYGYALASLEQRGIIRPQDARRLRRKTPAVVWAGDAA